MKSLLSWCVRAMTSRYQRRKKIMGRVGTEEKPCPVSPKAPAEIQPELPEVTVNEGVDLFSQALKALCERSPFGAEEGTSVPSVWNLPSGLASFLAKHSDSRKRNKKSHPGGDAKLSKPGRQASIWVETEDCFRELTCPNIETLLAQSTFSYLASQKCFSIPVLGSSFSANRKFNDAAGGPGLANEVAVNRDENRVVDDQSMDLDSLENDETPHDEKVCSQSQSLESSSGLEWILGLKDRFLLTSERPSKKRKLLGSNAGLEKLLVACPYEGNSSLCHFCCRGDTNVLLNRLIVCSSCKVSVHMKCYGLQEDIFDESWLCSWCKHMANTDSLENMPGSERSCVFCPKSGGALKVVHKSAVESGIGRSVQFAHLFCSLWMPEVYVDNTSVMEPIMNVDGIKETRKKLICNICKVKYGACVRCSNGACRTSFHPICAREASQRLEVWGKFGSNNIELRAFCSKHSGVQNFSNTQFVGQLSEADVNSSCITSQLPMALSVSKPHKLKIGRRNGDKSSAKLETTVSNFGTPGDCDLQSMPGVGSNENQRPEKGDASQPINTVGVERTYDEDVNHSTCQNSVPVLKKLIDRGKVDVKDVALEIGISADSLAASLADDHFLPEFRYKVFKWLKKHACVGNPKKSLKLKIKSKSLFEAQIEAAEDVDSVLVSDSIKDHVSVKSVPPRRRTTSNIRIIKDENIQSSSNELCNENGTLEDEVKIDQLETKAPDRPVEDFLPGTKRKKLEPVRSEECLASHSSKIEGNSAEPLDCSQSETNQIDVTCIPEQTILVDNDKEYPACSVIDPDCSSLMNVGVSGSYIHPSINKKLMDMQIRVHSKDTNYNFDGPMKKVNIPIVTSPSSGVFYNNLGLQSTCSDPHQKHAEVNTERLDKARNMGIQDLSPKDEVEGELIYLQHKLLQSAVTKKRLSDDLINKVAMKLPKEIDAGRNQRWDSVFVNQYLYELRVAKKQGRKERRHKEAQAVLAAATAAAASSSRISSFRKDGLDDSSQLDYRLNTNFSGGRAAIQSQPMPRPKETVSGVMSEKHSYVSQSARDISKEHPRSCDICRRSETMLNAILVCSSCKVSVHLDCYRSAKDVTGPWNCQLCQELLLSRGSKASAVNSCDKPFFIAECGICGGTTGAFRKSTDDQWVHAFCAEWVLDTTFRRGQVNPIEGMDTVSKGNDTCCVCRHKKGICVKCNYGQCENTFHPSCGRSAGFYMNIRAGGGKLQHKAYCEKHSLEQRNKADTQKHGIEELKNVKEIRKIMLRQRTEPAFEMIELQGTLTLAPNIYSRYRDVNLERLRLLCERIVKREKLKREVVLCSHDILASKRDTVALSALVQSPFFLCDVSSESATTSLKEHTDDYKSCSEAVQRSDDITVDSTVSGKRCPKPPFSADNDRKTDDSSTSHQLFTRKSAERIPFSGKQIPHRISIASRNHSDHGETKSKFRKHTETFEKELVMTSDQASMKNQRLPKGFVYVPIGRLSKDEQTNDGTRSCDKT